MPVDLITSSEFSQITKGVEDSKKVPDKPKPLVEKIKPEPVSVEDSKPKIEDKKPEVKATQQKSEPTPPEPQKEPEKDTKKDSKPQEKPQPAAMDKADPIADKLKEAKNEPKPLPPKRPPVPQKQEPKFDASKIAALIDQRDPQRHAATGSQLNNDATLGRVNGAAAQLSQNELAAFRSRVQSCWSLPSGAESVDRLMVVLRIQFNRNGTVRGAPQVVEATATTIGPVFAESAKRAILQCQPYTMFRAETYDQWKDLEVAFSPKDMF